MQQFVRSGTVAVIKSRSELLNAYLGELEKMRKNPEQVLRQEE